MKYPKSLENLINAFESLPGVGPKMAGRIVMNLYKDKGKAKELIGIIRELDNLKSCKVCNQICSEDICDICGDDAREKSQLMIVEDYFDLVAIESSESFKGYYYIIEGLISPLNNIMPENLKIDNLISRVIALRKKLKEGEELELIFALNPSMEGEATMLYIQKELENQKVKYTRLAMGVPRGSDIDYVDSETLKSAVETRRNA